MRIAVADIGGTGIKAGIWEDDSITGLREIPTEAYLGGEHVVYRVIRLLAEFLPFDAIGISTAGQVDPEHGVIVYANSNIPGYTGMKLGGRLEEAFGVPAAVWNDVNAAARGEAFYGAGRGSSHFLCLTYGTGVGGAIVMDGKIYTGSGYSAGEFGAMVVHPEYRNAKDDMFSGCYERFASTTALVTRVSEKYPALTDGRRIFGQLEEPGVREQVDGWIKEVAYGLVTLVHIFNPSLVVLGGGIMEQPYVIERVRAYVAENIMQSFRRVRIVPAELGNRAGMLGAAREALEKYNSGKSDG